MPIVLKSVSLNLLELSGPVQACNGIALPFYIYRVVFPDIFTANSNIPIKLFTNAMPSGYQNSLLPCFVIQGEKSFCAPDDYNTTVRCTETFWSPCIFLHIEGKYCQEYMTQHVWGDAGVPDGIMSCTAYTRRQILWRTSKLED